MSLHLVEMPLSLPTLNRWAGPRNFARGEGLGDPGPEGGVVAPALGALDRVFQQRRAGQRLEDFAGHMRREPGQHHPLKPHPFRMRAGHHNRQRGVVARKAQKLGFLAPDDVGMVGIALRHAGQDADVAGRMRDADGARRQIVQGGGAVEIAGLDPALPGAGHAADDGAQPLGGLHRGQMAVEDFAKTRLAGHDHALGTAAFGKHPAGRIDKPGAEDAGAPIDRRETGVL